MRTLVVSGILLLFIVVQLVQGVNAKHTIDGDGSGYYAYLTTVLRFKTTDFKQVFEYEKTQRGLDYMGHYFHDYNGKTVNKYYAGTAVLMLPFYILASAYSKLANMPLDGYNIIYQYAAALAAAFYLALGLLLVNALLKTFEITKPVRLLTILSVLLGTNLFYYAFLHPAHSHVYSFAAIAGFAYAARVFMLSGRTRYFYLMSLMLGIVGLIRPTNLLLVLLIPFFAPNYQLVKQRITEIVIHPLKILFALVFFLSFFSIQIGFNLIQTGEFILYTYKNEGFHFLQPATFSFLFSYRKGLFVYTPLLLLLFSGLLLLYRRSRFQFYWLSGFLVLLIYILSSWWNWFFGDSFGMRAMIDYYPIFAILLAFAFSAFLKIRAGQVFLTVFLLLVVPLNLVQAYQYEIGILHPDSMSKEKYWHVFLKTDSRYKNILGSQPEPVFKSLDSYKQQNFFMDMESNSPVWTNNSIRLSGEAHSGMYLAQIDEASSFSPTLVLNNTQLFPTFGPMYVSAHLMFRELNPNAAAKALMVYAATNRNNQLIFYKVQKLKQLPDNMTNLWRYADFGMKVPEWSDEVAQVKIYIWNPEPTSFQLDDFAVSIYYKDNIQDDE
ncbi:MAG: hypothetical protein KJ578_01425 [Bacteroidetes bacterium]|nr:hypothetical protein [Bacteroidota bacterium]MBU1580997.1 hypothetical protein [Bacteroidota bacterium]MBU2556422.1 hypothetical protein [Bacteroidota bacterium]